MVDQLSDDEIERHVQVGGAGASLYHFSFSELRLDVGAGYRVYFARRQQIVIPGIIAPTHDGAATALNRASE